VLNLTHDCLPGHDLVIYPLIKTPELATHRTQCVARRSEPFKQTRRVKVLLAMRTRLIGQRVVASMQYVEAYHTLLLSFEVVVDILVKYGQRFQ